MRRANAIAGLVLLLVSGAALSAAAQQPPAPPSTPEAQTTQQAPPPAPPATGQEAVTGNIDFGFRWLVRNEGNRNVYRSLVDYGQGPKFLGASLSFAAPQSRAFDTLRLESTSWGGEPYSSLSVNAGRANTYDFSFQYRSLDFFDNLPSWNNPILAFGNTISESGRDLKRDLFDLNLELFPQSRISPFFMWSRDDGSGPAYGTWIGPGNEYLSNLRLDDSSDLFRGGANIDFSRLNLTLEIGATRFNETESLFNTGPNPGNRRTPLLGQTLRLDRATETFRAEGNTFFTRISVLARPFQALDLSGQFGFSQPSVDATYNEEAAGNFVSSPGLRRIAGITGTATSEALRPRPEGNLGLEFRPIDRVRIVQSFHTNRFHTSGGSLFREVQSGVTGLQGTTQGPTVEDVIRGSTFFSTDYNRHQIEAIVQVHPAISLRGGHRLIWADSVAPAPILSEDGAPERGKERRSIGLGGINVRVRRDLFVNAQAEVSSGESTFFRTSLFDYQRVKIGGRYRPTSWMSFHAKLTVLRNFNDRPDIDLELHNRDMAFGIMIAPANGRRFTVGLDYTHTGFDSDILFRIPQTLSPARSIDNMDAHSAAAFVNVNLMRGASLNFGGTLLVNDGATRPMAFYQPRAGLFIPFHKKVGWLSEWRYYGFRNETFRFENFNTQLFTVGLRLTL